MDSKHQIYTVLLASFKTCNIIDVVVSEKNITLTKEAKMAKLAPLKAPFIRINQAYSLSNDFGCRNGAVD